jgi:nucleotide-binding universal stress UspA family protein
MGINGLTAIKGPARTGARLQVKRALKEASMYHHILVPTDGSALSLKAAKEAARLAKTQKARVTAVYAIPPFVSPPSGEAFIVSPDLFSPEEYKKRTEKHATEVLAKIEAEVKKAGVECDSTFVTAKAPWQGIIDAAKTQDCDLIVMASHGRKGIEGLLLGSETLKVLTHSRTPVLVCR